MDLTDHAFFGGHPTWVFLPKESLQFPYLEAADHA